MHQYFLVFSKKYHVNCPLGTRGRVFMEDRKEKDCYLLAQSLNFTSQYRWSQNVLKIGAQKCEVKVLPRAI